MYDGGKIIIGLLIFLVIMTSPIWFNAIAGKGDYAPDIEILTKDTPGKDECVMPTDYMRPYHMDLLSDWRDEVVRDGERVHVSPSGKKFDQSLTNSCMDCHSNKDKFCNNCHNYMDVTPYCWECHIEPEVLK